jgi:glucosyl-dolichyl phosphate glucuronosyltransferase
MKQDAHNNSLSVVLCTYNNAASLARTLEQLNDQILRSEILVEYVIVDNNSSDNTASTIKTFCDKNASFTYVFEDKQGLSHARNAGTEIAKGKYLLFTDDDAEIPRYWIQEYLDIIQRHTPVCAYSKIAVIWDQPKPWWYLTAFRPYFVELDYGDKLLDVTDIHHEFFGKNFCILKSEIESQGGFDPKLGRMGNKLIAGEETIIYRRMISAKKTVIYFPSAGVGHRLKPKEYTTEHIHKLFSDGAYTSYNLAKVNSSRKIAGRPLGLIVNALLSVFKSSTHWLAARVKRNQSEQLLHKLILIRSFKIIALWISAP